MSDVTDLTEYRIGRWVQLVWPVLEGQPTWEEQTPIVTGKH